MLSEGVLHGDLNEKQQRIKTSVEKLMHSQMGTVELECENPCFIPTNTTGK